MITRNFTSTLLKRFQESSPLIQVIIGPRQVGKTVGAKQLISQYSGPTFYASADNTLSNNNSWITEQWQQAKECGETPLLVLDEIQKIENWSEEVKRLWDMEPNNKRRIRLLLLGSSSLNIQVGLTESLLGRFELIQVPHWSFLESKEAFNYSLDDYLIYGGYPGAEPFRKDFDRWFQYLKNSVIDPAIGLDILGHRAIGKPALFRQAFQILSAYPSQEVSYNSLLGQLQDRGNVDIIKHYLELYEGIFFFKTIYKYSSRYSSHKKSSPKIISRCPALYTLVKGTQASAATDNKGFLFESVVGSDLINRFGDNVYYWREKKQEVDFIVDVFQKVYAIEVKSGRKKSPRGLKAFVAENPGAKAIFIHPNNYETFCMDPLKFLESYSS